MTPDDQLSSSAASGRALPLIALALAVAAAVMVGIGGPGYRMGWWHFRTAFRVLMKYGAYLAIAALVVSIVAAVLAARRPGHAGLALALVAALLAAVTFFIPWNWRRGAQGVPPIHDITTDFANPPALVHSRALRDSLQINPWQYGGDSIAAQQREAYPDVQPVLLAMPLDSAYAAAYRTATQMGWTIEDASSAERRIEATDRTAWFGFTDDVSIRVSPGAGISRVDVRSVSRVGGSDVGANAQRIRKYMARLKTNYPDAVAEGG